MLNSHEAIKYQEFIETIWVDEEYELRPDIGLRDWRCFQLQIPGYFKKTLHLVGTAGRNQRMHVSNPVTSIDRTDWTAYVQGGCVYALGTLNERSTFNEQAWQQWQVNHHVHHFVDVTTEFLGQFD